MKIRMAFGFRGKNQLPLFMVIKEYLENGQTVFAKVLFEIKGRKYKKTLKEFSNRNNENVEVEYD